MSNILEYKGYFTKIEFSIEDKVLHGKIEGINDLVVFESEFAEEIEKEFHDAVDDYLDFCARYGKEPNKSYKGVFNVRILPDLHRKLAMKAFKENISLNAAVEKAIRGYVLETEKKGMPNVYIVPGEFFANGMYSNKSGSVPISSYTNFMQYPNRINYMSH